MINDCARAIVLLTYADTATRPLCDSRACMIAIDWAYESEELVNFWL